jgi:hypothetical protein
VDFAWEQYKSEARKMLAVGGDESHLSRARFVRRLYVKVDVFCHRILLHSLRYSGVASFE